MYKLKFLQPHTRSCLLLHKKVAFMYFRALSLIFHFGTVDHFQSE